MPEAMPTRRRIKKDPEEAATTAPEPTQPTLRSVSAAAIASSIVPQHGDIPLPWGNVVSDVLSLDVTSTYAHLVEELSLGDGAVQYGAVLAAMDRAEANYYDACRLHRAAKIEEERIESLTNERLEILRSSARDELEREKADGKRSKAPTLQDIEDRLIASWPDEVRSLRQRLGRMHGTTRSIEELATAWRSRCATLRTIAERVAPTR